jgi:multidrug efflux pump subunit AcrB
LAVYGPQSRGAYPYEKALTALVDNIQHSESTTYNGVAVVKVYLQLGASPHTANAQVTAASQFLLRQLPPGILPPQIINFSASSVPILQPGISGGGLSESRLNDYATNYVRTQLITVPGAVVPQPYGGKLRQVSINMDQAAMESKGIAPIDLLNAVAVQSAVMPAGTSRWVSLNMTCEPTSHPAPLES